MLKVIGAGLGRTGTHSLAEALEILGFGPCYTILDVDDNRDHSRIWQNALDDGTVDWTSLYEGYQSAVEWPTVAFLPSVIKHYPEAKVVLTLRDPGDWYESAAATIFPGLEITAQHPNPKQREKSAVKRRLILEQTFDNRYWEKEHAIAVYEQHNQLVRRLVPEHRLLQFEVSEGWGPLCEFLGVNAPDRPFPRKNVRSEFLDSAPDWAKRAMKSGAERPNRGDPPAS